MAQTMTDGIINRYEEDRLRTSRDHIALQEQHAHPGSLAELDRAGADRVLLEAGQAATSVHDGDGHLQNITLCMRQA